MTRPAEPVGDAVQRLTEIRQILDKWRDKRWANFGAAPELYAAIDRAAQPRFPITSHTYRGEGSLHPCTADGYGTTCGASEYDHEESP